MRKFIFIVLLVTNVSLAHAVTPDEMLQDPALEARARTLSQELRCMVCQNQSIDDSEAPLAHDLRVLVRERLQAGDSNRQVLDYLVARYGEFVLLKPRVEMRTLLLWGLPPLALVVGAAALILALRRRNAEMIRVQPLSTAERERLAALVGSERSEGPKALN
jgi:cytochrome c-type biogenesis protein CcmH